MRRIDEIYTKWPFYGSRRIAIELSVAGYPINRKRVQRLMRVMGIQAIYQRPKTTLHGKTHKIYPYLLRDVPITHKNHVWSTDITYIPFPGGFAYLVAVMDWYSRYVLSWRLSNTMHRDFCIEALLDALDSSQPDVFNTDQGSQFTSNDYTKILTDHSIQISMDGRGRAIDNVWIERLWPSVKYEEVYLNDYHSLTQARKRLGVYFEFYNHQRRHQSLDYKTPAELYGLSAHETSYGQ